MKKKIVDKILEDCWKKERQKLINTLLRSYSQQITPEEIEGYVTDAFEKNYRKLLRGGFNEDDLEEHFKKSVWRSAFNLMKNRVHRDKLLKEKEDRVHVALFPFFQGIENDNAFWSKLNLECIEEQFIKLSQEERKKVHMEVLSLVETGYANEDDVADMYEKPRRWVSDKLREGKKALEIMIQKNCHSRDW